MKERIEAFLLDLDQALAAQAPGQRLAIYHLGRSALVWEYDYSATTQDLDIVCPDGPEALIALALQLFGKDTRKAQEHRLYLEVIPSAFPPLPVGYKGRARMVAGSWSVLSVYRLDPHDLVASKLRRFAAKDREDIRLLCDLVPIDPDRLQFLLEEAFPFNMEKDGDEYRDRTFRHLRIVQQYLRQEIDRF